MFRCPSCNTWLALSEEKTGHTVKSSGGRAVVSPAWACPECFLVGRLKYDKVIPVGRAGDHQVPIGTSVANTDPPSRVAVQIGEREEAESYVPLEELFEGMDEKQRWENCPAKRKHGWYKAHTDRETCPLCTAPLRDEDEPELEPGPEGHVEEVNDEGEPTTDEEEPPVDISDLDWEEDYQDAQEAARRLREEGLTETNLNVSQGDLVAAIEAAL